MDACIFQVVKLRFVGMLSRREFETETCGRLMLLKIELRKKMIMV